MGKRKKVENVFPGYVRVGLANRPKLTEFIKAAQGNRTLTQFAKDCNFSPPTLMRAIKDHTKPVSEELIKAIFENADEKIQFTLNDLLEVYGMLPIENVGDGFLNNVVFDNFIKTDQSIKILPPDEMLSDIHTREIETVCRLIIQDVLLRQGYSIFKSFEKHALNKRVWDLVIETSAFEDDDIKTWCIEIRSGINEEKILENLFSSLYLYSGGEEKYKISLVMVDSKTFRYICDKYRDVEIVDEVSVILIDRTNFKITEEFFLKKKGDSLRKKSTFS